jgi:hypothetical protein
MTLSGLWEAPYFFLADRGYQSPIIPGIELSTDLDSAVTSLMSCGLR